MKIGELADTTGLAASRIRFYEESGLLVAKRLPNGYREYGEGASQRLALIRTGQELGFSLAEIRQMLGALEQPDTSRTLILARLEKKSRDIAAMQERLALHQKELTRLTDILSRHDDQSVCTPAKGREAVRASLLTPPAQHGRRKTAGTR